ncbi:MAG: hydroxymethylbilane synthase [Parachlamydiaceae bacterium]|nr:hydroxymethylbilane synthase [Parachlamydiaceae bacterium]
MTPKTEKLIRIGSRGSKLALFQAERAKTLIQSIRPSWQIEIVVIKTLGDIDRVNPLHKIGGKGAFVKNIEIALSKSEVDIAIHSLKDVTSKPVEGLEFTGFLNAEAITDAFIALTPYQKLSDLPPGSTVATGSLRRKALLKKYYPEIKTVEIRGNVDTRMEKLDRKEFHGILLSEAGLIRLGFKDRITQHFTPREFCPAPGQGVITLQTRIDDIELKQICNAISDPQQAVKSQIEIAFLEHLDFDCHSPLGAHALIKEDQVHLQVFLANQVMDKYLETDLIWELANAKNGALEAADHVIEWLKING